MRKLDEIDFGENLVRTCNKFHKLWTNKADMQQMSQYSWDLEWDWLYYQLVGRGEPQDTE